MPCVARASDEHLDSLIEDAGLEETAAVHHERAGRFEKAALAARRAQGLLAKFEIECLRRAEEANLQAVRERRGSES